MLNKSGESGNSCLVYDLRINAFSLLLLSMMLAVGLSYIYIYIYICIYVFTYIYDSICYVEVCSLYTYLVESFKNYKWMFYIVKSSFYLY